MGMTTDMAPHYISVNSSGQMAYVLDANNMGITPVQLAVPGTEVILIQTETNKSLNICENPIIVADVGAETTSWLGNNVYVLVSQPQEFVVLEQEGDNSTQLAIQGTTASVIQYAKENQLGFCEIVEEEAPTTSAEDAKSWFRDSLISAAALSTLTSYVQSNGSAKVG